VFCCQSYYQSYYYLQLLKLFSPLLIIQDPTFVGVWSHCLRLQTLTNLLSWAAQSGHEAVVWLLVERDDVEVDSKDSNGQTPLSWPPEVGTRRWCGS
jgi:ankyrin repeat protein